MSAFHPKLPRQLRMNEVLGVPEASDLVFAELLADFRREGVTNVGQQRRAPSLRLASERTGEACDMVGECCEKLTQPQHSIRLFSSLMSPSPALSFDTLRAIGFHWDPIGASGGPAQYDEYLLEAVSLFRKGRSEGDVADFLFEVETKRMKLGNRKGAKERADFAAAAIGAYLNSLGS